MLTIITPCSRPENLETIKQSINFNKIDKWIICYDTSRTYTRFNYINLSTYTRPSTSILNVRRFSDNQIVELFANGTSYKSVFGHFQRNVALDQILDGYVYFLDDDNIMHPSFFEDLDLSEHKDNIYTFDVDSYCPERNIRYIARGNNPKVGSIDTSSVCIHKSIIKDCHWDVTKYEADGLFIEQVIKNNNNNFTYINKVLGYKDRIKTKNS